MQQTVFLISSSWLYLNLQQNLKGLLGFVGHLRRKCSRKQFFSAAVRRWKWEFQLTKVNFGVLRSESVKRCPLRASMRQLLTSELISKALWVGETACPGICGGKKKKKKSHIALSLPLCLLSLPLRTDRSFDSGSKFTSQTCWEAGERSDGKAFLHFKDPERLPDSLSKILRLIINLLFFFFFCTAVAVKRAQRHRGWRRESYRRQICMRQLAGLTFLQRERLFKQWRREEEWNLSPLHTSSNTERFFCVGWGFIHNVCNGPFNDSVTQMSLIWSRSYDHT